jgi:hypothetical protein
MRPSLLPFLLDPAALVVLAIGGAAILSTSRRGCAAALLVARGVLYLAHDLLVAIGEDVEDLLIARRARWDAAIRASVERGINSAQAKERP